MEMLPPPPPELQSVLIEEIRNATDDDIRRMKKVNSDDLPDWYPKDCKNRWKSVDY